MSLYKSFLRPLLFLCNPEWAHHQALNLLCWMQKHPKWFQPKHFLPFENNPLRQTLFGYTFEHPVGLAAGFDKNAELTPILPYFGFSFVEVGSISFYPCKGNPSPRLFRLPKDKALINRMGLNNGGILDRLPALENLPKDYPVGINLTVTPETYGMAAIEDLCHSYQFCHGLGAYTAFNISCPNTSDGKTFEDPEKLQELLMYLTEAANDAQRATGRPRRPWLLKLSADLDESQLMAILTVAETFKIDGFICSNTSGARHQLMKTSKQLIDAIGRGGLSGKPIQQASTELIKLVRKHTQGWTSQPIIIGVGGVSDAESAKEKLEAGANLLQLYTSWVYEGPFVAKDIAKTLRYHFKF